MKTINDSDKDEKSKLLREFIEVLNKHTSDDNDVYYVLRALRDWSNFMANQRFAHGTSLMKDCRVIKDLIEKSGYKNHIAVFENISESASEAAMLAGENTEAVAVISKMENDLNEILS